MCKDQISNSVLFNNETLLFHTWYARSYQVNKKHTERINTILVLQKEVNFNIDDSAAIVFKKRTFAVEQKLKKFYRRIKNKLSK